MAPKMNVGELQGVLSLDDQLTKKLEKADKNFKATGRDMDTEARLGLDTTGLDRDLRRAEGSMESSGSNLGGLLVAGAAGAMAGGGALIVGELTKALDRESSTATLGIQLGLTPEMATAAGKVSGEIYADAFGDSLDEVNQALRFVGVNMGGFGDKSKEEVEGITKGVLVLSDAFDQDLNQVTAAAGTIMQTGLAKDGMGALDLLTRGLQSPANKADDLLDTFIEYSTQFRKLGITGPEALGLMSQGLAAGARDADTVADSLKEFAIRAIDGSETTKDAFESLGLKSDEMAAKIAAGGPIAAEGLQLTLDKLREIKDPVEQNRIGVELFGTKWEDMGAAVNGLDLSTAVASVGTVEGAMTNATNATDTNKAKVEEWRRSLETNVTDFTANSVIPWFDTMGLKLEDMGNQWDTGRGLVGDFHNGLATLGDGFIWLGDNVIDPFVGQLQTLFGWIGDTIEKVEDLWAKITGDGGSTTGGLAGLTGFGLTGGVLGMLAGSFDTGGVVGGRKGAPQLALVHGGETILPTHRASSMVFEDGSSRPDNWGPGTGVLNSSGRTYEQSQAMIDRSYADLKAGMEYAAMVNGQRQQASFGGIGGRPIVVNVMLDKRQLGRAVIEADRPVR